MPESRFERSQREVVERAEAQSLETRYRPAKLWMELIEFATQPMALPKRVVSIRRANAETETRPLYVLAEDGTFYYFKTRNHRQCLAAEWIVSQIGLAMGCPVPECAILLLGDDVLQANAAIANHYDYQSGLGFASRELLDVLPVGMYQSFPACEPNFARVALLAALFGATVAANPEIYKDGVRPHLLHALDFHLFLHYPPASGSALLEEARSAPPAEVDLTLRMWSTVSVTWIESAMRMLASLSDADIARIVSEPPREWGISLALRVALADIIAERRAQMLAA
jgi:hypothetical protein